MSRPGAAPTVFKDVPSENVYYPKWSADGAHLAFTLYDGTNWHLVMVNADGSGFRYIKKAKDTGTTLYSPCWAPDGKSLVFRRLSPSSGLFVLPLEPKGQPQIHGGEPNSAV